MVLSRNQHLEPNLRLKKLDPVDIRKMDDGVYRADMGVNFSGLVEIVVRGKEGDLVEFSFFPAHL